MPQSFRLIILSAICLRSTSKRSVVSDNAIFYILGAFRSSSGIAQGARLYADSKEQEGFRVVRVDVGGLMLERADLPLPQNVLSVKQIQNMGAGTMVIHANPPQFQLVVCRLGKKILKDKHLVAYWAWELESIPKIWKHALNFVDEIVVPSAFVRNALRPCTDKRITVVPHPVPTPVLRKKRYAVDVVIPFLVSFELGSSFERKNPLAVLKAFSMAFQAGEAELVFKVTGAREHGDKLKRLWQACSTVSGVQILDAVLSVEGLDALYMQNDIYLSLHRSEGYGLSIREAMQHGLHVVATGWSGNMDFMYGPFAHCVPYTLVPVKIEKGPYKGLQTCWAEPDVGAAANILKKLRQQLLERKNV